MALSPPIPSEQAEVIAGRLRVIGDPTRLRILDLLRVNDMTVGKITEHLDTSQQNVSKHLGVLLGAGVVARRKAGTSAIHSVADSSVFDLCEQVCGSLELQFAGLQAIVESRP